MRNQMYIDNRVQTKLILYVFQLYTTEERFIRIHLYTDTGNRNVYIYIYIDR